MLSIDNYEMFWVPPAVLLDQISYKLLSEGVISKKLGQVLDLEHVLSRNKILMHHFMSLYLVM